MKYHFPPTLKAIIKKRDNNKYWADSGPCVDAVSPVPSVS